MAIRKFAFFFSEEKQPQKLKLNHPHQYNEKQSLNDQYAFSRKHFKVDQIRANSLPEIEQSAGIKAWFGFKDGEKISFFTGCADNLIPAENWARAKPENIIPIPRPP